MFFSYIFNVVNNSFFMDYDHWAHGYDELHKTEQLQKFKIIKKMLAERKHNKILDIGSGTGLSAEVFEGQIYGIEPSIAMLEVSVKKRLQNLKAYLGKGEGIENIFDNNFFDMAICVSSAHHFSEPEKVLKNMVAVSKKDALFCFSLQKRSDTTTGFLSMLKLHFDVLKQINEDKDLIVLFRNKKHKL